MYARRMTVREIQAFLAEQYGTKVSPEFISSVTDALMAEVTAWQARPLEPMYPVVFFDALRVKIRKDAVVRNKATGLGIRLRSHGTTSESELRRGRSIARYTSYSLCQSSSARETGTITIRIRHTRSRWPIFPLPLLRALRSAVIGRVTPCTTDSAPCP
jgi:Transposase, Mutator family